MEIDSLKALVLAEWERGYIVCASTDGLLKCRFEDFKAQPIESMLYDMNRNIATILSNIDDNKWINDFALVKTLEYYYNRCIELEKENCHAEP